MVLPASLAGDFVAPGVRWDDTDTLLFDDIVIPAANIKGFRWGKAEGQPSFTFSDDFLAQW